ncbi:adenylate/guanylate cyclase domain-containing protein [Conexibacter sp. DBS9H8]|uniref:adenylate/guanylate cyclase domain-containing protein n=1 Tax=Conexibacter sp. DBS9H8 TaxID=2937801 RepID=UPI00200DB4EE|nr:adenylate/guanylate cyclase domain-containing protein [Conexibacter sp. DBS9H8]
MKDPVDRMIRALARRNSFALLWAQFGGAHLVLLGGMVLFRAFVAMDASQFWLLVGVSQGLCVIDNVVGIRLTRAMFAPVRAWERGERTPEGTVAAWRALASLPLEYFRRSPRLPLLFSYLPFIAFAAWRLGIGVSGFVILALVGTTVIACAVVVRYFLMEIVCRPVLERLSAELPDDFHAQRAGLGVSWRLFLAAPVINIVTALIVAGLSNEGRPQTLDHLAVEWALAVGVSLTLSLELLVLVVRTVGSTLSDISRAIDRVQAGDFSVRVPVVSTDEGGMLAQSFNRMVEGLEEREALREAFSAYVDPGLAERVMREGSDLEGEERQISILFLDIREFTAFSERARPRDVMALLNEFWELVVPVLLRWGGHANKFIGDGLLGVFGAPDELLDHALAATSAALEIADLVSARYDGTINVGIGVNTGQVIAGTVGGGGRVEFTVIGDAVNTAARVEEVTRATGDTILITEATRAELPDGLFHFEPRGSAELKGKSVPVQVWQVERAIRARRGDPSTEDFAAIGSDD